MSEVWGSSVASSVSFVATDSLSVKPGEVARDDTAELATEPPPKCETAPRNPGAGDAVPLGAPKLKPSFPGSAGVDFGVLVPNKVPNELVIEASFAEGVEAVNLKVGAALLVDPKEIPLPCFQVLSVPAGEARTDFERLVVAAGGSALLGVLGLEPNMPSPGTGPPLVNPPAKMEAPGVGVRAAAGAAVKLKVDDGL